MKVAQTPEDAALLTSALAQLDQRRRVPPPPAQPWETPEWREAWERGMAAHHGPRRLARLKVKAHHADLYEERARRILEWQELAVYWDGPGSEGRCE